MMSFGVVLMTMAVSLGASRWLGGWSWVVVTFEFGLGMVFFIIGLLANIEELIDTKNSEYHDNRKDQGR